MVTLAHVNTLGWVGREPSNASQEIHGSEVRDLVPPTFNVGLLTHCAASAVGQVSGVTPNHECGFPAAICTADAQDLLAIFLARFHLVACGVLVM